AVMEIYNMYRAQLSVQNTVVLFEALHVVASHAHKINSDSDLRSKLQELGSMTQMQDPPLLLENHLVNLCRKSYKYILALQNLHNCSRKLIGRFLWVGQEKRACGTSLSCGGDFASYMWFGGFLLGEKPLSFLSSSCWPHKLRAWFKRGTGGAQDEDAIHDEGLFCAHVVDRSSYLLIWKLGFSQKDAS
ncbi:Brefeldin A-inhibited guanine nucleotide-exchange protein 2, partial [Ananas comosus]